MAYTGFYATDGSWNVHVVDGLSKVDLFTVDGHINVTGSTGTGLYHPCGCIAVTTAPGSTYVGRYAPDGSLYINSVSENDGSQKVTFIP